MMKTFGKTRLSLAVGAALMASSVGAVNISSDGIGEVAISPYYTVRDGWQTLINLTNTSDVPVVVKVRIHEAWNSRDVLDFNVALSAFDVWSARLVESADNTGAELDVSDTDTCTIPQAIDGLPLSTLGVGGLDDRGNSNDDLGPQDADRLREGYIEFIVMGHAERDTSYDSEASEAARLDRVGGAIENHDCGIVELAFNDTNILNTAQQFGEPINVLKFNYRLLNAAMGVEAGGAATTWANFYNPAGGMDGEIDFTMNAACTLQRGAERDGLNATWVSGPDWDPAGGAGSCMNLISPQTPYGFLEPSLNDAYPMVGNWFDDASNMVQSVMNVHATVGGQAPGWRGVDAVSATIQRSAVINEWSSNPTLGVASDWVVTFPTKTFYVDQGLGRQFGIVPGDRDEAGIQSSVANTGLAVPYPPFAEAFTTSVAGSEPTQVERSLAGSCSQISFERFDREENTLGQQGGVVPSPAPSLPVDEICYEANVLTFNGGNALGSPNSLDVDTSGLSPNTNGWMRLNLDVDTSADPTAINANGNGLPGGNGGWAGLPVTGFMVKTRSYGDVTRNNASSMDHGYERWCNDNATPGTCVVLPDAANAVVFPLP